MRHKLYVVRYEKGGNDDGTDVLGGFERKCLVLLLALYVLHLRLKCVAKVQPIFDCRKETSITNGSVLHGTVLDVTVNHVLFPFPFRLTRTSLTSPCRVIVTYM